MLRAGLLAAVIACLLGPALSARVEFTLRYNGEALPGGEVCFFLSGPVAETHPRSYWFFSNDVRCHPADLLFDFPAGRVHYFVRHRDGYISRHKASVVNEHPTSPDAYKRLIDDVYDAVSVDVSALQAQLGPGEWLAFLTEDSADHVGMMFPVPDGTPRVLLPIHWPLLPMVISNHMPVRIGDRTVITRDQQNIRIRGPERGRGDVLSWIEVDREMLQGSSRDDPADPLRVALLSGATQMQSVFGLRHPRAAYAGLQVFKNVSPGPASLELRGRFWQTSSVALDVAPNVLNVTPRPLRATPGAALRVEYAVGASAVPLSAAASRTCDPPTDVPALAFTLHRCPQSGSELADCRREGVIEAAPGASTAETSRLPPGHYIVEAHHPAFPTIRHAALLPPLETTELTMEPVALPLYGRVTHRGRPLRATVTFAGGSAFERVTATNEDGRYETILGVDPGGSNVEVKACDGSIDMALRPDAPLVPNQQFDIALPGAAVAVTVQDRMTGKPIARARTRVIVYTSDGKERDRSRNRALTTGDDGIAHFHAVLDGRFLEICASAQSYRTLCLDEKIRLTGDEERAVTIELANDGMRRGRVVPSDAFAFAWIYWVSPDGQETETMRLERDGTFYFTRAHTPGEYLVIASPNRPLFVLDQWMESAEGDVIVNIPQNAPVRTLRIESSRRSPRYVTIGIAGRLIPTEAFGFHLMNRGIDPILHASVPLTIPALAATGPITVIAGPARDEVPAGMTPDNFYRHPVFQPLVQRVAVPDGSDRIVVE